MYALHMLRICYRYATYMLRTCCVYVFSDPDEVSALFDPRSPCADVRLLTPAEVFPTLAELRPACVDCCLNETAEVKLSTFQTTLKKCETLD